VSKIDNLRKKHQKEIDNLQKRCKHKKVTDWLDEYWAPGHSSFRQVKICEECGKTTETRNIPLGGTITTSSSNTNYKVIVNSNDKLQAK
jgi:hypothetical protein